MRLGCIPQLLTKLNLKGCTVSVDAMGCQKAITQQIREQKGHYLPVLKDNQGTLHDDVKLFIESELRKTHSDKVFDYAESSNTGHGRIEHRRAWVTDQIGWLRERHPEWMDLRSIGMIESIRHVDDQISIERRFYIGSGFANATQFLDTTRRH